MTEHRVATKLCTGARQPAVAQLPARTDLVLADLRDRA